jgi:tetratricopeptide (TPR) repeat protein
MFSILTYVNNKFEVDGMSFSNSTVLEVNPDCACDESIKELFYQVGSLRNQIIYNDDTIEKLSNFEPKYNKVILYASKFKFEEDEKLFKQVTAIASPQYLYVNPNELFEIGITSEEQAKKIELIKLYRRESELSNEYYFSVLNDLKKSLLLASDWSQLPDVQAGFNDTQKEAWIKYRLALRELDNVSHPLSVRVPALPT